eukprot:GHVH01008104.1.p1 GENE.GHVH01008104.1~~GHVH01008104.1.p1  ORF type:complete len:564 (+),score=99.66 GHVH01008104.1:123-1814(+)
MANMFRIQGAAGLMKDGGRIFGGNDAKLKNVDAARQLTDVLKSSMGPHSAQKMIVNHISKVYVTSDASTIVEQMEVQHPAVKTIIHAAQSQAEAFGDQTSFLMCLSGELLIQAGALMEKGVHCVDIIRGFEMAKCHCDEVFPSLCVWEPSEVDLKTADTLSKIAFTAISSKAPDYADLLSQCVGEAAQLTIGSNTIQSFRASNVRTLKVPGGAMTDCSVVHGLMIARGVTSQCREVVGTAESPLKCVVLNCDLAHLSTDTAGHVLITDADKMASFNKEEDTELKTWVTATKDKGVQAVIVGGHISDTAQHFIDELNLLTIRVSSKFELMRLCKTLRAPALSKLVVPQEDDLGVALSIKQTELGSTQCTTIEAVDSGVSTVVLRGSSQAALDEVERAIDDGLGVIEAAMKDAKFVVGGGASDMALSLSVSEFAGKQKGLEQYSSKAFAEALKLVPSVLIENSGLPKTSTLASLAKAHKSGKSTSGINMDIPSVSSMFEPNRNYTENHLLHLQSKKWAIAFAVDSACTILNVDQIIMSKPSGGPKLPKQGHWDGQEDKKPLDGGY